VSHPLPWLGINVAYRWNERDNDSPIDTYSRVLADSGGQDPDDARVNRPYSFEQHKVNTDVSFRVYKRTKLTLMYEWNQMTRNLQEVHENNEYSVGGKLVSRPNQYVNLGARFERSFRDGSGYDCVKPFLVGRPWGTVANPTCQADAEMNSPQLRKYYMADRRRSDAHTWLTITPLNELSVGSHLKIIDDDYYNTTFGVTEYRLLSTGVDLSYAITDALNFNAFYNHDKTKRKMDSASFGTNWSSKDKDTTNTVGAGIDFDVLPERLSIGFEYLFAKSTGRVDTFSGTGGTILPPFSNNKTKLHDVSVRGNLQITRNLSMRVGYLFEKFDSQDWAIDSMCPACLSSGNEVVASGARPPKYDAHVVSLSMIYRFW
jgi:MtrB/PioB family decaheme-associated outer membrane protein